MRYIWSAVIIFSIYGYLELWFGIQSAHNVTEQCYLTGYALCCAVIPYCIARSLERLLFPLESKGT